MSRPQFAFRKDRFTYEIGLVLEDGRFVEIARAEQQYWANRITVVLNSAGADTRDQETVEVGEPA